MPILALQSIKRTLLIAFAILNVLLAIAFIFTITETSQQTAFAFLKILMALIFAL